MRKFWLISCLGYALATCDTWAAEKLKIESTVAFRSVLEDLGPKFQQVSGAELELSFDTAGVISRRVSSGEGSVLP